jgi:hypothetical protein
MKLNIIKVPADMITFLSFVRCRSISVPPAAHMAAFVAVRHSGKSTDIDLDDRSMVQKLPAESHRKVDIVLGTLLVG